MLGRLCGKSVKIVWKHSYLIDLHLYLPSEITREQNAIELYFKLGLGSKITEFNALRHVIQIEGRQFLLFSVQSFGLVKAMRLAGKNSQKKKYNP